MLVPILTFSRCSLPCKVLPEPSLRDSFDSSFWLLNIWVIQFRCGYMAPVLGFSFGLFSLDFYIIPSRTLDR